MMRETEKKKKIGAVVYSQTQTKDKTGVCTVLSRVLVVLFYDYYLFSEDARARSFAKHYLLFFSYSSMFHIG